MFRVSVVLHLPQIAKVAQIILILMIILVLARFVTSIVQLVLRQDVLLANQDIHYLEMNV